MPRVLLVTLLPLVFAAACDDGDDAPAPTATLPAATATDTAAPTPAQPPTEELGGPDGFREFAAQIQDALDESDVSFFRERLEPQSGVCSEDDVAGGLGSPPCTEVGEPWEAFPICGWRSECSLVLADEAMSQIADLMEAVLTGESDEFGDAAPAVYALAPVGDTGHAVLTAIIERPADFAGEGPLRSNVVLSWRFDDGRWRLTQSMVAAVLGEEFLIPCPEALNYLNGEWERYPDPNAPAGDPVDCPL